MQAKQYSVQTCNYVSSFRLRSHVKWYCTSYYNSQNLQVFVYFLVSRCLQILNSLPCINIIKILHVIFVLVPSELFYWQLLSVRCTNSILAGRYSLSSTNLCKKKSLSIQCNCFQKIYCLGAISWQVQADSQVQLCPTNLYVQPIQILCLEKL